MAKHKTLPPLGNPGDQHARFTLALGRRTSMTAEVSVTSSGLLAIGALVSSILLSTAVIVHTARRPRR